MPSRAGIVADVERVVVQNAFPPGRSGHAPKIRGDRVDPAASCNEGIEAGELENHRLLGHPPVKADRVQQVDRCVRLARSALAVDDWAGHAITPAAARMNSAATGATIALP